MKVTAIRVPGDSEDFHFNLEHEDNVDVREVLSELLTQHGATAETAAEVFMEIESEELAANGLKELEIYETIGIEDIL